VILHGALSTATLVLSWAVGGACIVLGARTIDGWLRQRDRTRALLALSIVLLCGCGVAVAASILTRDEATWTSDLTLTLFLASGWAFFAFRSAMTRLPAAVGAGITVAVVAAIVLVWVAGISVAGAQTAEQRLVVGVLAGVWLVCVVEPGFKLWRI
jgi:membrane-associated HD superfamily phosphohydrolase